MKSFTMDSFEKIIENPLFFRWVFYPDEKLDLYWNNYIQQNLHLKKQILFFKNEFEKTLKHSNSQLSEIEKKEIAQKIILKIDKKKNSRLRINSVLRYAAIALIFFTIGSSVVFFTMKNNKHDYQVNTDLPSLEIEEPVLITSNNKKIQLKQGNSELDYTNDDIIIDKNRKISKVVGKKSSEINTLVIPYGNQSKITLSDGTKVWLNAGSRLIYPSKFIDKTRKVYLSGEAFFDVIKNPEKPFIVKTSDVLIEVTGTRFNISAYPEDYSVQTVLEEGKVSLRKKDRNKFSKAIDLYPGQMAYFNKKSKETNIRNVDVNEYSIWKEGLISFSDTDLNRVTKKLERYYNIRFKYDDPLKGFIQISGKLDITKDEQEVIEYLTILTGLSINKVNNYQYVIK